MNGHVPWTQTGHAFNGWYSTVQRLMRMRETAVKVRAPIVLRALASAFKGWRQGVETRKTRVARAKRIVQRMRHLKQRLALDAWLDTVVGTRTFAYGVRF